MAPDISAAKFTTTFLQYAKHTSESQNTSDVIMAENGNDVSDSLDGGFAGASNGKSMKQSRNKDIEVINGFYYISTCCGTHLISNTNTYFLFLY
jgi:hypothetical protein